MDTSVTEGEANSIGFIGLGIMGAPMAGHLLNAGHSLYIHTGTAVKASPLLEDGATCCGSPAEVGTQALIKAFRKLAGQRADG